MSDYKIQADYDHDGRSSGQPHEYALRQTWPGGILVANLDADRRSRPEFTAGARPVELDYQRAAKSSQENDLLRIILRVPQPPAPEDVQYSLVITDRPQGRTRIYDQNGRPLRPLRTMPNVYPISFASAQLTLQMEAQTLPGAPISPSTLGLSTPPAWSQVDEGSIRLELTCPDASGGREVLDWACFTVAPLLFCEETLPAEAVYICELQDPTSRSSSPTLENQPALADFNSALAGTGVPLVRLSPEQCGQDGWIQDQFKITYCHTPAGLMYIVLHFPRMGTNILQSTDDVTLLSSFVRGYFPSRQVGLFQEFWDRRIQYQDSDDHPQSLTFGDSRRIVLIINRVYSLRQKLMHWLGSLNRDEAAQRGSEETFGRMLLSLPSLVRLVNRELRQAQANTNSDQLRDLIDAEIRNIEAQHRYIRRSITIQGDRISVQTLNSDLTDQEFSRLCERVEQIHSAENFGGNIIASPPVSGARFGKVIIGNKRTLLGELVDPDLKRFLRRQNTQPLVEIDTSWLQVGHIDELITFAPSNAGGERFAILRASPAVALIILYEALRLFLQGLNRGLFYDLASPDVEDFVRSNRPLAFQRQTRMGESPITHMLRGKTWLHHHPPEGFVPLEPPLIYRTMAWNYRVHTSIEDYEINPLPYQPGEGDDRHYPANISVREYLYFENGTNEEIEPLSSDSAQTGGAGEESASFMETVDEILAREFPHISIIKLPVLFDSVEDWEYDVTSAFTPNLVNMQIINSRAVVPRPFGPRMKVGDTITVLQAVFERLSTSNHTSRLSERYFADRDLINPRVWICNTNIREISEQFRDGFPERGLPEIERLIQDANQRGSPFLRDGRLRTGWHNIMIPEETVDLFEAYTQIVLESIGLEVHWVDSWYYHVRGGEIHCGTNVKRQPQIRRIQAWWQAETPTLDEDRVS
jgi:hypothetical protein